MFVRRNLGVARFVPLVNKIIGNDWVQIEDGMAKRLVRNNNSFSLSPTNPQKAKEKPPTITTNTMKAAKVSTLNLNSSKKKN